jgi:serine/threonine protein kinase
LANSDNNNSGHNFRDSSSMSSEQQLDDEQSSRALNALDARGSHASERTVPEVFSASATSESVFPPLNEGQVLFERYIIIRKLARGGFSDVYLAYDQELDRNVAIKRLLITGVDPLLIKSEAKTLASLDHPGIVRVFDICHDTRIGYLMVMQYVAGPALRELMSRSISMRQAVEIAIRICGALIHAHSRGVTHRDIKPTNILMFNDREPLISDFGLAISPTDSNGFGSDCGTPRYMSPEQIRCEANRIGPSSDIFSTGVVLYEMLVGRAPFNGDSPAAINRATIELTPAPLTSINPLIPPELDAICRQALRKNVKDRYSSMEAFQADLIRWLRKHEAVPEPSAERSIHVDDTNAFDSTYSVLSQEHSTRPTSRITLRGLQPFEEADGKFFLALLPGERAVNGLPVSLEFWTSWIESFDNAEHSRVGILYGPSGSGKTSLVRAGIIPHLSPEIFPIVIDGRRGDLRKQILEGLPEELTRTSQPNLALLSREIRDAGPEKQHRKIVLILDHFDTWARSASPVQLQDCADALRQCDGENLQALIIIRDEYWTQTVEFMHRVACSVEQWKNARPIELFDRHHATRLLESIGRSYGSLPPEPEPISGSQKAFIEQAVAEMAEGGRVIPIQLAMFAKTAKLHRWHPDTLQFLGGIQGAFVGYIQDHFEGKAASPVYQRVSKCVAEVLHCLLPNPDQSVRGTVITIAKLEEALAKDKLQSQLHRALSILVEDLRLVVRVAVDSDSVRHPDLARDPTAGAVTLSENVLQSHDTLQIAHDFLTGPIATWVNQVRKSNWNSRGIARLNELSGMWNRQPHRRYMPSLSEFLVMQFALPSANRTALQQRYMRAASRVQLLNIAIRLLLLTSIVGVSYFGLSTWYYARQTRDQQLRNAIDQALNEGPELFKNATAELQSRKSLAIEHARKRWFDIDPRRRTRAILLEAILSKSSVRPLAIDIDHVEPELSKLAIEAAMESKDALAIFREVWGDDGYSLKAKCRSAITLAYLGDLEPLIDMLDFDKPTAQSEQCVREAIQWRYDWDLWIRLASENGSPSLTYFSLAVIAAMPPEDLPIVPWSWLAELASNTDAGVRRTADHLLSRFDLKRRGNMAGPNLKYLKNGKELVRIPAGRLELAYPIITDSKASITDANASNDVNVKSEFWITSIPITNQEYDEFERELREQNMDVEFKGAASGRNVEFERHPQRAATGLNPYLALGYCNWMSRRENRQPVYDLPASPRGVEYLPKLVVNPNADGFRLATSLEMAYCLQPTFQTESLPTVVFEHSHERQLPENAFLRELLADHLLPNRFGIHFDVDGSGFWVVDQTTPALIKTAETGLVVRTPQYRATTGVLHLVCDSFPLDEPSSILLDSQPPEQSR